MEPIGPLGLRGGQCARRTQTVTAHEVELYAQITGDRNLLHFDPVLSIKSDKPVCQLRVTITNQAGAVLLEGECWTYTLRPA
jgi:hypothetical protein